MNFSDITASDYDAVHLRHRLSIKDLDHPDFLATTDIIKNSRCAKEIVDYVGSMLANGTTLEDVIQYVNVLAVRDGWYLREELGGVKELERIVSEDEMDQIMKEIRGR